MKWIALFILAALIFAPVVSASTELEAIIPLEYKYSGKSLPPGYTVDITVQAEGAVLSGGLADAGFMIDGKTFGIGQDGRDVYIVFFGYRYKIDTLPWVTKKQYNDVFTVKLYCPGEAPEGWSPQDGYLWMEVSDLYGYRHYYLVKDTGTAPGIYWYTESNNILSSDVYVGEVQKWSDCGSSYGGNPPTPGEGSQGDPYANNDSIWSKVKWILAGAGLLIALAIFLRVVL